MTSFAKEFCPGLKVIQWMVPAMYFNIRSFLHLAGAAAQKENYAINLGNEYVCFVGDWKTTLDKKINFFVYYNDALCFKRNINVNTLKMNEWMKRHVNICKYIIRPLEELE